MQSFNLKLPAVGFVVATRAALAFGLGLLVANRIPETRRKQIALALIGLGAATTIPAVRLLRGSRMPAPVEINGNHSEFRFARM